MIQFFEQSRKAFAAVAAILLSSGCSSTLVERAIDARGGPLESYRKSVDADVKAGMPGTWAWEVAYRVPDSFRWTLATHGEEQSLLFDGDVSRHQLGTVLLPPTAADDAVRSQAHWFAVTSLDVLLDPTVAWREVPRAQLPTGTAAGIVARFGAAGPPFELYFDDRNLLVRARGRVALAPIGSGLIDAEFRDYREVEGFLLPFAGAYRLDGHDLMTERVRGWRPDDPSLEGPSVFSGQ